MYEDGSVEEAEIPQLNEREAQLADRIRNLRSMPVDTDENAQAALAEIKDVADQMVPEPAPPTDPQDLLIHRAAVARLQAGRNLRLMDDDVFIPPNIEKTADLEKQYETVKTVVEAGNRSQMDLATQQIAERQLIRHAVETRLINTVGGNEVSSPLPFVDRMGQIDREGVDARLFSSRDTSEFKPDQTPQMKSLNKVLEHPSSHPGEEAEK